ncbi:hypothetical protein GCM10027402_31830 [Arthrobacter monumenti]
MMAVLRAADAPVLADLLMRPAEIMLTPERHGVGRHLDKLHALNADTAQLERALAGLLNDKLAEQTDAGVQLPA